MIEKTSMYTIQISPRNYMIIENEDGHSKTGDHRINATLVLRELKLK